MHTTPIKYMERSRCGIRFNAILAAMSLALSVVGPVRAEDEVNRRQIAFAQTDSRLPSPSDVDTLEAERKALAFIQEHQPRLIKLMSFLKDKQPAAYQKALREMARSQQRLEGLSKRDPELYEIELELWQIRSRLRLLAAEMSVAKSSEQEKLITNLTKLVEQEASSDLKRLQVLRQRAALQVAKLDKEIQGRTEGYEELVAKALKSWQNRIKKSTSSSSKPSSKKR